MSYAEIPLQRARSSFAFRHLSLTPPPNRGNYVAKNRIRAANAAR
jgi:hypothetical protein